MLCSCGSRTPDLFQRHDKEVRLAKLIALIFKWPRMIRFKFLLATSLILLKEILLTNLKGSLDLQ